MPQSLINPGMVDRLPGTRQTEQLARVTFAPSAVRYIKLGQGGQWADEALDQGIIPFGYPKIEHPACMKGDWAQVRQQLSQMRRTPGGVSNGLRELREFYELPGDALWVTCARGFLVDFRRWRRGRDRASVARLSDPLSSHANRLVEYGSQGQPTDGPQPQFSAHQHGELSNDHLRGQASAETARLLRAHRGKMRMQNG